MKRIYRIIWHDTIDSTNSEAARRISDIDNLSVIAAKEQSDGRGQRGNRWNADAGENLTFSVIIRPEQDDIPPVNASGQFLISELAALSVTEYLETRGIYASIKWPNDIYCHDRKICGILIENCIRDGLLQWSIAGIGINLNQMEFPPEIPNPTSVMLETGMESSPDKELAVWTGILDGLLDRLASEGPDTIERLYLGKMYRRNERHLFEEPGAGRFHARILGVTSNGCLEAVLDDGSVRTFAFKEIRYVINDRVSL